MVKSLLAAVMANMVLHESLSTAGSISRSKAEELTGAADHQMVASRGQSFGQGCPSQRVAGEKATAPKHCPQGHKGQEQCQGSRHHQCCLLVMLEGWLPTFRPLPCQLMLIFGASPMHKLPSYQPKGPVEEQAPISQGEH